MRTKASPTSKKISFRLTSGTLTILILIALALVMRYLHYPERENSAIKAEGFYFFVSDLILILAFSQIFASLLDSKQFWKQLSFKKRFFIKAVSMIGFGIVIAPVLGFLFSLLDKTINTLMLTHRFQFAGILFAGVVLLTSYVDDLKKKTEEVELENERLRSQNLSSQLQLLRRRIRPHFLFNSLNSLTSMIRSNDGNAEEFSMRLSELYRYLLQTNVAEKVTIREELKIVDSFLFMLKSRFEDNLDLDINIRENLRDTFIPPFTFQMLIENAVKHNIISRSKPLKIEILDIGSSFIVRNNLQEREKSEDSNHIGLTNLNQSYLLMCGHGVAVNKTDQVFEVLLPVMTR